MNNIEKVDFLESIFSFNKLPTFYKAINSDFTKKLNYSNPNNNFPNVKKATVVKDIPSYASLRTKCLPKNIKQLNIEYYKGFAINFDGIDNLQSYLKSRFGNTSRYKLRRSIKKLESAFNISYKMYFGDISQDEYDYVFNEFFKLLKIRSIEKGILDNENLHKKEYYQTLVFPLIKEKKASLFVIYNNKKPIDICLNFHVGSIVFQLIRTYDICYSKFNTGYIDLIKQVEWCLENNIRFITFSYGDYYWKRRWCNYEYNYYFNIFFNKNSFKSSLNAFIQFLNLKLRHKLREHGLIDKFHELKEEISNKINPNITPEIIITNIDYDISKELKEQLNMDEPKHLLLKKHAFDFLFNFNEKENDIKLYSLKNRQNDYVVLGKKNTIKISTK